MHVFRHHVESKAQHDFRAFLNKQINAIVGFSVSLFGVLCHRSFHFQQERCAHQFYSLPEWLLPR